METVLSIIGVLIGILVGIFVVWLLVPDRLWDRLLAALNESTLADTEKNKRERRSGVFTGFGGCDGLGGITGCGDGGSC